MSCYPYRSSRNFNFDKKLSYKDIKREHDKARRKSCSSYEFDRIEDDLYKQASENIPFFGDDIGALTYLAWEKEINDMHSFMVRKSKYESFYSRDDESYILNLYTSSFKKHAREWWDDRQYHVNIGRQYPIHDWNELKACMRRKFVPREIERNLEAASRFISWIKSRFHDVSGFSSSRQLSSNKLHASSKLGGAARAHKELLSRPAIESFIFHFRSSRPVVVSRLEARDAAARRMELEEVKQMVIDLGEYIVVTSTRRHVADFIEQEKSVWR
ncbi:hypothetical protein LR48_Vigan07g166100 [Vigna angularis]|uniref:Retrotransposon gag domain-containing protein n=1 Tax=Phaseolus angularis TaxID=3914 RepID=A0A0L9UZG8_PHAAN|nr:hypothetical protein LR48_Vigan07g166100 [Vigna angularis]